jgi:SAM-dependent methyltransferase
VGRRARSRRVLILVAAPPQRKPPGPIARRLLRGVTIAAARAPWSWRLLRGPIKRLFDRLAPGWDERVGAETVERLEPLDAALAHVARDPGRVLDIGTGTGTAAFFMSSRYPEAEVLGIDLSEKMIDRAREKATQREARTRFEVADIARFAPDSKFDLVMMMNMPPFFDRVADLVAPGGYVVSIASRGRITPFFTPAATLERGFGRHGLRTVATDRDEIYYVAERPAA